MGALNLYSACSNSPVTRADTLGLISQLETVLIADMLWEVMDDYLEPLLDYWTNRLMARGSLLDHMAKYCKSDLPEEFHNPWGSGGTELDEIRVGGRSLKDILSGKSAEYLVDVVTGLGGRALSRARAFQRFWELRGRLGETWDVADWWMKEFFADYIADEFGKVADDMLNIEIDEKQTVEYRKNVEECRVTIIHRIPYRITVFGETISGIKERKWVELTRDLPPKVLDSCGMECCDGYYPK